MLLGAYFVFKEFGGVIAALLPAGLFLQGDNQKRREAKAKEEFYAAKVEQEIEEVVRLNAEAEAAEEKIEELDNTEFVDNGESNEEIVNRIRRNGGL